jgi:hypothetical protein
MNSPEYAHAFGSEESLPDVSKEANRLRAAFALHALETEGFKDEPEENVVDLLTCLRHYCDNAGVDWDEALERSTNHYGWEKGWEQGRRAE